ncbi:dicarboxylate/amino acid:cation symporter, partial [Pseudomonas guineae]|uniref:dicarboxylate/amino acid:cation symporter n=1 Tax=Pseudomonas guineae TaxID=425504 RepID=UPI0030EBDA18
MLIGLGLGVLTGMLLKTDALVLAPIGTLFLNAIKMLIVPLVFVSLVAGITAMSDSAKLGRISVKTIAIYLVTTAFAVSIGLLFGALFTPGEGMNMVASGAQDVKQAPSLMQILVDLVPTNPVNAFAQGNILQIIVFAIALGVSMNMLALLARLSPLRFFRGVAPALAVAFSTSSSAGTLPVSIECARKNLGVSQGVAGFVLPVGATINMDGTAIYQGVLALFIAQAFG